MLAQDDVNPYKKLSKSFFGAVKRDIPNRNDKFFDSTVYGKIISAQADRSINNFIKTNGKIVAIEKTEVDTQGCKMVTVTSIKTNNGKFLWYLYFDQAQYIERLEIDTFSDQWFYKPKTTVTSNYSRKEIVVESNPFIKLPGSLFLPNNLKKSPAVILVHGSGPHDRNQSIGKNKIFLDIALDLVQKGIAVLIYDKRTYVYQFNNPFSMDSMDYQTETVEDAVAAFNFLKKQTGVDTNSIFIAGHSQGALCAPLIAKGCKNLKGLILLAAPARSLLEILPEQLDYIASLKKNISETEEANFNALKWQVKNALKPDLNLKSKVSLPFNAKPKYWLFDRNYKVLDEAKKLGMPMLLLQGGRDYNVVKKDYDLWLLAMSDKSNFKSVFYDDLDHLFFEGKGMAKPEDVLKPNHVSPKITEKIAEFVLGK
jgi:dienelactone hydrolase